MPCRAVAQATSVRPTHALRVQGQTFGSPDTGKSLGNQGPPQHPLSPEGRKAAHGSCSFLSPQFLICSFLASPPTVVQECFFFLVISFLPLVLILFLQDYGRHNTSPFPVRSALCPEFSISKAISCSPLTLQASCCLPLFRSLGQSFQSPSFPCMQFPWKNHISSCVSLNQISYLSFRPLHPTAYQIFPLA